MSPKSSTARSESDEAIRLPFSGGESAPELQSNDSVQLDVERESRRLDIDPRDVPITRRLGEEARPLFWVKSESDPEEEAEDLVSDYENVPVEELQHRSTLLSSG